MPGPNSARQCKSRMNHLAGFLHLLIQLGGVQSSREISRVCLMLNKLNTPCQSESEFVNHLVASSTSGTVWIRNAYEPRTYWAAVKEKKKRVLLLEATSATAQRQETSEAHW